MLRVSAIRVFGTAIAVMALAVVVHSQADIDASGLQALWLCDEGSGSVAADSSGNGMDATFIDSTGLPAWAAGKFGGGLAFTQTGWTETPAPLVVETKGFTMGAWVKPAGAQKQWANIMSSHQEPPSRGISFEQSSTDLNVYGVAMGAGAWTGCGDAGFSLDTDAWQHVVIVRSNDGATADSYINGAPVLVDGVCGSSDAIVAATSNFRLGNWVLGSREWNGTIDEAFVFNRAVSEADIIAIYNFGFEVAMGGTTAVSPSGKLGTVWADLKTREQ